MQKRFYIDTSIWLDLFEDRSDNIKPLGEFAFMFLKNCLENRFVIIVLDAVLEELERFVPKKQIFENFSFFASAIIMVNYSESQAKEARDLKKTKRFCLPYFDLLHAIIARDNSAVLVSRDAHFKEISFVESHAPEELL